MFPLLALLISPLVALASCAPMPSPAPVAPLRAPRLAPKLAPRQVATAMAPAADWRDWPLTSGDWVYRQDARGSIALFGPPGMDAELTLRCDRTAQQLYLSRRGTTSSAPITIRTSSLLRALPAAPAGDSGYLAAALAPGDPLLDAMGYSRGRFVVEQPGLPTLVVPAWAEILRVTEDCR